MILSSIKTKISNAIPRCLYIYSIQPSTMALVLGIPYTTVSITICGILQKSQFGREMK